VYAHRRILAFAVGALAVLTIASVTLATADDRGRGLLANTLWLAAGALAMSVPAGTFLGLLLARSDVRGRQLAVILLGGLLLVPLHLQAAAWQAGFGIEGWQTASQTTGFRIPWLDGWQGAIWVHGYAGIPWVALFVGVAARTIPASWEESALLDLTTAGVIRRLTLRLLLPAMALGALWVAITTMTEMSVTDLFAVRTYAEEVYVARMLGSWSAITGLGPADEGPFPILPGILVIALASIASWVIAQRMLVAPRRLTKQTLLTFSLGAWRPLASVAVWLLVGAIVFVPLGNLIYKAGSFVAPADGGVARGWSFWKAVTLTLGSPRDHSAEFLWSAAMAGCTALVTLAVAIPLAYASRVSSICGVFGVVLAIIGLATPGPLWGLGLIEVFGDPKWPWLNYLYDRTIAVAVLAQSMRAFPLVFFLVWQALRSIPPSMFEMAQLDGVGPLGRLWLAARQRLAAIALAGLAAAVLAFGELAATILVVPPGIEPLSVRVFGLLHFNVEDQIAGISLVLILLHAVAGGLILFAARRLFRIG
jgi:iron(III) transport system permease protein